MKLWPAVFRIVVFEPARSVAVVAVAFVPKATTVPERMERMDRAALRTLRPSAGDRGVLAEGETERRRGGRPEILPDGISGSVCGMNSTGRNSWRSGLFRASDLHTHTHTPTSQTDGKQSKWPPPIGCGSVVPGILKFVP